MKLMMMVIVMICVYLVEITFFNCIVGGGVESNWVHSALRPLIGLLCQPGVIMMLEKLVE
jgi:hypothetical protein